MTTPPPHQHCVCRYVGTRVERRHIYEYDANNKPLEYWGGGLRGELLERKVKVVECCVRRCHHREEIVLTRDDWYEWRPSE